MGSCLKSLVLTLFTSSLAATPFIATAYELPHRQVNAAPEATLVDLQQFSRGVAAIGKTASPAVVFVSVSKKIDQHPLMSRDPFDFFFGPRGPRGFEGPGGQGMPPPAQQGVGSGFFVDLAKGYVITNNHVVEGADTIDLKLANGATTTGKVVGRDPNTDIAVVQIKGFKKDGLGQLTFADSETVTVGDVAIALGAPFGLEESMSMGIISATGRGSLGITQLGDFLQTDAAINPGNSGGPLLGASGQVIGVNTAIFSQTGAYNGIGFAVPSNLARLVAERLINDGKMTRGYIGASLQSLDASLAEGLNLPADTQGALVASIQDGSPAAKAGLEPGDLVRTLDGKPVPSVAALVNQIGLMSPGKTIEFGILRQGKRRDISVRVAEWPMDEQTPPVAASEAEGGSFGLALAPFSAQEKQRLGIESERGVLVANVRPGSPAARAGLQAGDLLLTVNSRAVTSPEEVTQIAKNQQRLTFRVERQGNFFFASLRLDANDKPKS